MLKAAFKEFENYETLRSISTMSFAIPSQ